MPSNRKKADPVTLDVLGRDIRTDLKSGVCEQTTPKYPSLDVSTRENKRNPVEAPDRIILESATLNVTLSYNDGLTTSVCVNANGDGQRKMPQCVDSVLSDLMTRARAALNQKSNL